MEEFILNLTDATWWVGAWELEIYLSVGRWSKCSGMKCRHLCSHRWRLNSKVGITLRSIFGQVQKKGLRRLEICFAFRPSRFHDLLPVAGFIQGLLPKYGKAAAYLSDIIAKPTFSFGQPELLAFESIKTMCHHDQILAFAD